jgi:hypothetical protein
MASYIGRRKFLATLGGAAVARPLGSACASTSFETPVSFDIVGTGRTGTETAGSNAQIAATLFTGPATSVGPKNESRCPKNASLI